MDTSTAISSTSTEIADTQQLPATEWRFGDGEEGDWVPRVSVGLTWGKLDVISVMDKVRNDHAGAIVLFAGMRAADFSPRLTE